MPAPEPKAWRPCLLLLASLSLAAPARADGDPGPAAAALVAPGSAMPEPITPVPPPPALNSAKLALGERLFADARLSRDNARSCASCHDTQTNGAGNVRREPGLGGIAIERNTPTVFNAALNFRLNWEGNVRRLEDHAEQTLRNPAIMAISPEEVIGKLARDPAVARQFRAAFERAPDAAGLLEALATYERSLLTPGSRFDRWLQGDQEAITAEELSGYQDFKSLGCVSCHQGVNIGGNLYQRHGIFAPLAAPEPVRVRVPSLRNVAQTPPYFHDGSAATLQEAVVAMARSQLGRSLSNAEAGRIVGFLRTLTGEYRGRPVTEPDPAFPGAAP